MASYIQLGNNTRGNEAKKVPQRSPFLKDYPTLIKDDFKLSKNGLSLEQQDLAWKKIHDYLHAYNSTFIGYQINQSIDCTDRLKDYLDLHVNNVGDPFVGGKFNLNTKVMECGVLDYFAKLWNIALRDAVQGKDRDEAYWGYVVSMGCTEANIYALYNARDYLSGEPLLCNDDSKIKQHCTDSETSCSNGTDNPNAFTPVAFYSEDAHYSQAKTMVLLKISTFHKLGSGHFPCPLTYPDDYPTTYCEDYLDQNAWPRLVPVGSDGSMHLPALVKLVSAFVSRGYPPIVIFTCGTTFTGAYDNPQAAINELVSILKQHNLYKRRVHYSSEDPSKFDIRHGFWFHVDGALGAAHLPFLEMAINEGLIDNPFSDRGFPVFDFRIPEIMSIIMSSHKWLGSPFPSGIFMTRRRNQLKPVTDPYFIGGGDTTLAGSRNGHVVMTLWDLLSRKSHHDLAEQAVRGEKMAAFTLKKLQELQEELGKDLWVSRSPCSLFICFKQPRSDIVRRYSLACKSIQVKTKQGALERRLYSHICLMSHVDEKLVGNIIEELNEPGAFPDQNSEL